MALRFQDAEAYDGNRGMYFCCFNSAYFISGLRVYVSVRMDWKEIYIFQIF